jgi:RimK family alpha-L-glutamate ligase
MSIFANAGIPVPITNFTNQEELISYPNVAKPRLGSHGKGIYVVNSKEEFPRNPENYLFQEVLPNNSDYRIIVLKNKVIGTISRKAINGNFVSNVSAGGIAKNFETTNKMKKLAIKLAKICKLDFCGIDLMKDSDGELKVLEVNRNLEFNGFEKASNILIPTIIEKFILNSK